ncbi:hypothetical protein MIR68_002759 [Amoeboaphelidium protococcarum]|nr:hypothetical protein MIR68_002759 [Amoeboaphelidium protococcarum]
MMAMNKKPGNELPSKEAALFKQILKQYEHKQYKKGLKNTDAILKKFPENGETLAMRGLFLSHLDNKKEAYECVKKGLRFNLTSSICWHVYGLLYRSDKNYEEAVKCYKNSLKYDKENIQVMRDFAFLQVQMRDFDGLAESMHTLLTLKSNQRMYWIGFALANYLKGNQEATRRVLDAYEGTVTVNTDKPDYEHSEFVLWKAHILSQYEDYPSAIKYLLDNKKLVLDTMNYNRILGQMYVKSEQWTEAERVYLQLVDRNSESRVFIEALVDVKRKLNTEESAYQVLCDLQAIYSRSNMIARLKLLLNDSTDQKNFQLDLHNYILKYLRKGAPSLFVLIAPLYESGETDVISIIEQILTDLRENTSKDECPTFTLWLRYLMAHHHLKMKQPEKALVEIDAAIEHTPTQVECYMLKARVLKHLNRLTEAAEFMNTARLMDLQDRFLNTKAVKYYLRADMIDEAEDCINLFTKNGNFEEKAMDLVEMQCLWYIIERANSHLRLKQYGLALRYYHYVCTVFEEICDDQFDFHAYCLRKLTLCSYSQFLKFEDEFYAIQKAYIQCAVGISEIMLLRLKDQSGVVDNYLAEIPRLEEKYNQRLEASIEAAKDGKKTDVKSTGPKAEDKFGVELLTCKAPTEFAIKVLSPALKSESDSFALYRAATQVFIQDGRLLLAVKSLNKATLMAKSDTEQQMATDLKAEVKNLMEGQKVEGKLSALALDVLGKVNIV